MTVLRYQCIIYILIQKLKVVVIREGLPLHLGYEQLEHFWSIL